MVLFLSLDWGRFAPCCSVDFGILAPLGQRDWISSETDSILSLGSFWPHNSVSCSSQSDTSELAPQGSFWPHDSVCCSSQFDTSECITRQILATWKGLLFTIWHITVIIGLSCLINDSCHTRTNITASLLVCSVFPIRFFHPLIHSFNEFNYKNKEVIDWNRVSANGSDADELCVLHCDWQIWSDRVVWTNEKVFFKARCH